MSHRTEILLVLLLAGAVAIALVAGTSGTRPTSTWEPVSTYRTGPMGGRAAYDVLARLGVPVERRRTALFDLARQGRRRPAVLAVVSPEEWLVPAEREAVAQYVGNGGVLFAAGEGGGLTECFGWRTAEPDTTATLDSVAVAAPEGMGQLPRVEWVLHPRGRGADTLESQLKRSAEQPKTGFRRLLKQDDACRSVIREAVDTLLTTRTGKPVLVRLRFAGGGSVVLLADDAYLRNAAWRTTDVPLLLVPLLQPSPGVRGHVSWDEYHHGYGASSSTSGAVLEWMVRSPAGWLLLQLIVVGFVWLAVTAVRFGPPRPVLDRRRRSPLEHVEALAAGLEGASGADTAVLLMISGLRRRLSRTAQPIRGDLGQWLRTLELVLPGARGRAAARRLQDTLAKPGGAERVLAAAQAAEDVWQALHPQRKAADFSTR
ncbi:MAG TPA: DUF4350 domain-containing protein [Gemmatimonadales bacterium]|nr:DUF4350 domain-containing protein [Gemmatimonadales bacterium]